MNTMKIKDSDVMNVKNHPAKQQCDAHRSRLIFPKHFSDLTYLLCISFQKLCNQASYVCTVLIWDGWVGPSIGKHNTQALPV